MAQPTLKMIEEEIEAGGTLVIPGSTTTTATLRLLGGTAPTNPVDGDVWWDGTTGLTGLKIRTGGVTRTVTLS